MVLPQQQQHSSRLSALIKTRNGINKSNRGQQHAGMNDYLKKSNLIPHQRPSTSTPKTPIPSESIIHSNKVLDGVVACLDVR